CSTWKTRAKPFSSEAMNGRNRSRRFAVSLPSTTSTAKRRWSYAKIMLRRRLMSSGYVFSTMPRQTPLQACAVRKTASGLSRFNCPLQGSLPVEGEDFLHSWIEAVKNRTGPGSLLKNDFFFIGILLPLWETEGDFKTTYPARIGFHNLGGF